MTQEKASNYREPQENQQGRQPSSHPRPVPGGDHDHRCPQVSLWQTYPSKFSPRVLPNTAPLAAADKPAAASPASTAPVIPPITPPAAVPGPGTTDPATAPTPAPSAAPAATAAHTAPAEKRVAPTAAPVFLQALLSVAVSPPHFGHFMLVSLRSLSWR